MDKQRILEGIRAEIEATSARLDAGGSGAAESLARCGDEEAEVGAAEDARYLEELRDDFEITEATFDLRVTDRGRGRRRGTGVRRRPPR